MSMRGVFARGASVTVQRFCPRRLHLSSALPFGRGWGGVAAHLWLLKPILTPFLAGAVLEYILDPAVEWLVRRRIPRAAAAGLVLALLVAVLEPDPVRNLVAVGIVFGLGLLLESFVLTPWLVGQRIGLHPVAVVLALLAFGHAFGFFGVLLALPASAALLVGLRHLRDASFASPFYRDGAVRPTRQTGRAL